DYVKSRAQDCGEHDESLAHRSVSQPVRPPPVPHQSNRPFKCPASSARRKITGEPVRITKGANAADGVAR
ncbi:hypothetical protein, partial [Burkholderia ubonensis]|uniref:hypothetical protein n=1 Tax=Burkholderia ubonensis TaxID=101571 RepID=UPI002ABDBA0D